MAREEFIITARDQTKEAFRSVSSGLGRITRALGPLQSALIGAAGIGGIGLLIKRSMDAVDAADDLAESLRVSTSALQGMTYAGQYSGVGMEKLTGLIGRQTQTIAEAVSGNEKARKAFAELGLDLQRLANSSPDQAFGMISDKIKGLPSGLDQARLAVDIFGKQAMTSMGFIRAGSQDIAAMTEEGRRLGVVLSDVDVAKVTMAKDAMARVGSVLAGIGNTIAIKVAPYIEGFARYFTESAKAANGWKNEVGGAIQFIARAVGFAMDAFRGLQVVWKVLEVAFKEVVNVIVQGLAWIDRSITAVIDKLPGVSAAVNKDLQDAAAATSGVLAETHAELQALLMAEMPSEGLKRSIDAAIKEFDKLAEAKAKATQSDRGVNPAAPTVIFDGIDEKFLESINRRGEALATEREKILAEYEQRKMDLENYYVATEMTEETYRLRAEELERAHKDRLRDLEARDQSESYKMWVKNWQGKALVMAGVLGGLAILMDSQSKKQFEIGKKASIAQAVIDTIQGAQAAFTSMAKIPIVGPALGAAAAAVALAAGYARVRQIKATQFGGGALGSVSASFPTPGPTNPTSPPGLPTDDRRQGNQIQVIIQGNVLTQEFVRDQVAPVLADLVNNGDTVIIDANSRQAQEIRA